MPQPIDLNGRYYTLADAASVIGMTTARLRQLIRSGDIEAVAIGENVAAYLIKAETVAHLIMYPKKRGRPRTGPPAIPTRKNSKRKVPIRK